ncbi:MAG: hypothetical protein IT306_02525 [Chloroflexi bacterium]|nr:hypothetical protein [Chloroflexota bacterium]
MAEPPPDRSDPPQASDTADASGAADTSSLIEDDVLLDGARHHSELALAALFDRHGGRVLSLAASIVGDHAQAESIVLDVFMRCWHGEALDGRTRTPVRVWLINQTRQRATPLLAESQEAASHADDPAGRLRSSRLSVVDPRPLRDRLLARARGEESAGPALPPAAPALPPGAASTRPIRPTSPPIDAFPDPFPGPAAPIRIEVHPPTAPPTPRGDAIEPIPSSRIPHRTAPRKIRLVSLMWGAALLFVLAAGLFVGAWSATGPHASPTFEVLARLPGGQLVTLTGTGLPVARARLFLIDGGLRAELAAEALPPTRPGRAFQVWFGEPGQPFRTGGTFTANQRGVASGRIAVPLPMDRVRRISITEESATGSANPSGVELLSWTP